MGAAPELDIGKIHNVTASAGNLTLGAVSDSTKALDVSVMDAKGAFVLNAGSYREGMDFQHISGGTVTMTFGDLTDNFSASAVFRWCVYLKWRGGPCLVLQLTEILVVTLLLPWRKSEMVSILDTVQME